MAGPTIENRGDWFVVLQVVFLGGWVILEGEQIKVPFPLAINEKLISWLGLEIVVWLHTAYIQRFSIFSLYSAFFPDFGILWVEAPLK